MEIIEIKSEVEVKNSKNNLNQILDKKIADELPNTSGFCMVILGSSDSGKTTLLYSLMNSVTKKGIKHGYKRVFNKIYVISPTIGKKSIKNDPFTSLPENQIFREVTMPILLEIEEELKKNREEEIHSLLILDDVGSQLKRSQAINLKLTSILQNRRHLFTSCFALIQKFRDMPTGIRSNMSHFITFFIKNNKEEEAVVSEMFKFKSSDVKKIFDYVFQDKYDFLYIDMSLKKSAAYIFHRNFNRLELNFKNVL